MSTDPASAQQAEADAATAREAVGAGRLPIHGAAVEHRGHAVVLAGASGAGKSTLAAAATLHGFGYLADEVAVVDPDTLLVHPYHRALGLRPEGRRLLGLEPGGRDAVAAPWLDGRVRSVGPTPVAAIAVVTAERGPTTEPAGLSPASAMVELLQHLVADDDEITACFGRLDRIVRRVPVVRLTRSSPEDGVQQLIRAIDGA